MPVAETVSPDRLLQIASEASMKSSSLPTKPVQYVEQSTYIITSDVYCVKMFVMVDRRRMAFSLIL